MLRVLALLGMWDHTIGDSRGLDSRDEELSGTREPEP